jgi:PBP1b-binding outer membrane lipoprotein LpoB
MKKALQVMLLLLTAFCLDGCNKEEEAIHQEMEAFIKEYKTTIYSIDDPLNPPTANEVAQKAESYLTKNEFENLMTNRIFELASKTANSLNKRIELEAVLLENATFNDDGGGWDCEITIKIKLADQQSSKTIEKKGQLSIMRNSSDELKVFRDWEERIKIDGEML